MKQYVITNAYKDNYNVIAIEDGKIVDHEIVAYYELSGVCNWLENHGYKKAYYLPMYHMEMMKAKEEFENAEKRYKEAQNNQLVLDKNVLEKFEKMINFVG